MRIGIVVGEASGDILGSELIKALREHYPEAHFEGVGGPKMMALGFNSLFDMERLSVMGFVEPLKRLPELLHMRRSLVQHFSDNPPDLFLGIDSPDFNLGIERRLKQQDIKTAHYVSPSVWAWRQKRVFKIKKSVDLMLTLLPFEADFYRQYDVPVAFVGHPLADLFPLQPDQAAARDVLGLDASDKVLALMPGSRGGEVRLLAPVFIETVQALLKDNPQLKIVLPAANAERKAQLQQLLTEMLSVTELNAIQLLDGQSETAMTAADTVLLASGTTTLEAMLLKKPMVVAYKVAPFTYFIASRLVKTPYISLPNLLAQDAMVPEIIQHDVTVERLYDEVSDRLQHPEKYQPLIERFAEMHQQIKLDASAAAAKAIIELYLES